MFNCFFGLHTWYHSRAFIRGIGRKTGKRCMCCGKWHKSAKVTRRI